MEDSELNMMYEKEKQMVKVSESSFRNSVWPSLKPFVNGGLAAVLPLSSVYFLQSCVYHILNAKIKSSGQELINPKWLHQTYFNVSQVFLVLFWLLLFWAEFALFYVLFNFTMCCLFLFYFFYIMKSIF